jgi:hypothetical protein
MLINFPGKQFTESIIDCRRSTGCHELKAQRSSGDKRPPTDKRSGKLIVERSDVDLMNYLSDPLTLDRTEIEEPEVTQQK